VIGLGHLVSPGAVTYILPVNTAPLRVRLPATPSAVAIGHRFSIRGSPWCHSGPPRSAV